MDEKEKYREFVLSFFRKLGSTVRSGGPVYEISGVPKSFSDLVGFDGPYKICFDGKREGVNFVFPSSVIGLAISKFLDNSGKTTLLSIEFDVDPLFEISKKLSLKNCEIEGVTKRHRNNYFSRFSFMTHFRYFNEKKQTLSEVYVHNGKIVGGDLTGYNVVPGEVRSANLNFVKRDYEVARLYLKELLKDETDKLSRVVGVKLDEEISRVREYYKKQLDEFSNDLNEKIEKIQELELEARSTDDGPEKEEIIRRVQRMRVQLSKVADDEAKERVLKEEEFTIRDTREKYSLNISNRILNTTVIYYPVFSFNLYLKNKESKRFFELVFDPLTKSFENLKCDDCGVSISEIQLCNGGHVVCENCLTRCSECGGVYCTKCVERTCSVCGKGLC